MLFLIITGIVTAFFCPMLYRALGKKTVYLLALLPVAFAVYFLLQLPPVSRGAVPELVYEWVPQLGVNLVFYLDGLSIFFALLISFFGFLVILYASGYLRDSLHLGRFYMYLVLFMVSMIGVVVSGNLILLFVFWELTSLSSYLLISYDHEQYKSRAAALQAMLVTVLGGLVMLVGFVLLGAVAGSYDLRTILTSGDVIRNSNSYIPIVILVLVGAFTKSAQFPFHFWLPNAMAAPTPVSAYLHSATMVKAGVFLVARLNPALGGTDTWQKILVITGAFTMVLGAVMALRYTDLKKILAYTTISALGTLFLMLGAGTAYAAQAAIVFILAHALYKGTLFMMAGNLDHEAGSRDIADLSGLRFKMPFTAWAAILACFSMSGIIPFLGFIGKELIYEAALDETFFHIITAASVVISGLIMTISAINIGYGIFFGKYAAPAATVHEAPFSMLAGPVMLSLGGLLLGILPGLLTQPLLDVAVIQVLPEIKVPRLSLWHGFNLVLMLSLATTAAGIFFYFLRHRISKGLNSFFNAIRPGPAWWYERSIEWMLKGSYHITRFTQNGRLRYYIATIIWLFCAMVIYVLVSRNLSWPIMPRLGSFLSFRFYEEIICLFIVMGVVKIFYTKSRVTALAAMGVAGYGLALIFIVFSAPDTAITQFLVETLTVVLFVLVLHKLPLFEDVSERARRYAYLFLSSIFGFLMSYIILLVKSYPMNTELKEYIGAASVPLGHGRNIVNVILVDFRALDTLGEAVVLAIAAMGIFSLLKLKLEKEKPL